MNNFEKPEMDLPLHTPEIHPDEKTPDIGIIQAALEEIRQEEG